MPIFVADSILEIFLRDFHAPGATRSMWTSFIEPEQNLPHEIVIFRGRDAIFMISKCHFMFEYS